MKKTKLYVAYKNDWESGGEVCAGQEGDKWAMHEDEYYSFELVGVFRHELKLGYWQETLEVEPPVPKEMFLVTVLYQSGNTFGTTHGNAHVVAIFKTEKEAKALARDIREGAYEGYEPWDGYFQKLEEIRIDPVEVRA